MKNSIYISAKNIVSSIVIITLLAFTFSCNENDKSDKKTNKNNAIEEKKPDVLWKVKTILPDGQSWDVKAVDANGDLFAINAIQDSDQDSFLNIKAFVGDKKLPVKILLSKNKLSPVKAIDKGGLSYNLVAVSPEGEKLSIKGVKRFGNIVLLKAMDKKGKFYSIKAISPEGKLNDVLGIKINIKDKEMSLNGFPIYAHVKAMHQSFDLPVDKKMLKQKTEEEIKIIWNVKAVTLEGKNLPVKAFDTLGNKYDVKAIQDSKQASFMNVKAFLSGSEIPIKIVKNEDGSTPLIAIDYNGNFLAIKAIGDDGSMYPVMGMKRSGNIIHVKAVNDDGSYFAVKAFSPNGELNDVKGVKIFERPIEMNLRGAKVYGHVKAIKQ